MQLSINRQTRVHLLLYYIHLFWNLTSKTHIISFNTLIINKSIFMISFWYQPFCQSLLYYMDIFWIPASKQPKKVCIISISPVEVSNPHLVTLIYKLSYMLHMALIWPFRTSPWQCTTSNNISMVIQRYLTATESLSEWCLRFITVYHQRKALRGA